jgi:hypothetical protein
LGGANYQCARSHSCHDGSWHLSPYISCAASQRCAGCNTLHGFVRLCDQCAKDSGQLFDLGAINIVYIMAMVPELIAFLTRRFPWNSAHCISCPMQTWKHRCVQDYVRACTICQSLLAALLHELYAKLHPASTPSVLLYLLAQLWPNMHGMSLSCLLSRIKDTFVSLCDIGPAGGVV